MDSLFRYHNEKQDADGERLWWPGGINGFPFRGPVPPTTYQSEYDNLRPVAKARTRIFYLSKPDDHRDYTKTREKCANGLWLMVDRDRQWDEETKNYRIYLEWVEPAYELPPPQQLPLGATTNVTKDTAAVIMPYSKLNNLLSSENW